MSLHDTSNNPEKGHWVVKTKSFSRLSARALNEIKKNRNNVENRKRERNPRLRETTTFE